MLSRQLPILFFSLVLTIEASAKLNSPFASTVSGLEVGNAHLVIQGKGQVYRGSAPLGKADQLKEIGITDILIFKNETKNEVQKQIEQLQKAGYTPKQIHHISFHWKEIGDFKGACEQTLEALRILQKAHQTTGRSLYFHCTMGEDRTGLLSGLFIQLTTGAGKDEVFEDELCAKGYEAGNPNKPRQVVSAIRKNLTPLFLFLSNQIEAQNLDIDSVNELSCEGIENELPELKRLVNSRYRCGSF